MDDNQYSRCTDFLSRLSADDQKALCRIGTQRAYAKDELVFSVGCNSEDIYIIVDGRVKIFELSEEGKEVILWFCFPGELFGVAEALGHQHCGVREVNALACSDAQILTIKHYDFVRFLKTHPDTALTVIELLSYRLRELGDVLLNLASNDVTSRVIKLLTRLGTRYGKTFGQGLYLDIPLTHQEMADMIGTSRQTVTTVLGSLKRMGKLRVEQRTIYIQDGAWVKSIMGEMPVVSCATG